MDSPETSIPPQEVLAQMSWVRELAARLVRSGADADDVTQEVWIAASESSARSHASVRAWLAGITRNVVLLRARADSRRRDRELQTARSEVADRDRDVLVRAETCQRVAAAVIALDEPYRSTVLHRYFDGSSTAEIAAREKVPEPTVRKRLSRAHEQLRATLDREFDGGRSAWVAALLDVTRDGKLGAARPIAVGLGSVLLMKKILVVVAALLIVAFALWFSPAIARLREPRVAASTPVIATEIAADQRAEVSKASPQPSGETRSSIADVPKSDALTIDGVVVNLAYPNTADPPTPAVGVAVTFASRAFVDTTPPPVVATTDREGRFHLEYRDPGVRDGKWEMATLSVDGDERFRLKSRWLTIRRDLTSPKHETVGGSPDIELIPGVPLTGITLERAQHGDLAGIVVDDDEKPLRGVIVKLGNASFFGSDAKPEDSNTEVSTDATGTFVFHSVHQANGFYPGTPMLIAQSAGLRMIPCGSPAALPKGGWSDVRLRMIATGGRVTVRVRDASGEPEAGVSVGVGVSRAEPNARWEPFGGGGSSSSIEQSTDAEGRAVFDDVWIGKRLALVVRTDHDEWIRERAEANRIDLQHAESGAPIVIPATKNLDLDVVLPAMCKLRGRVVDADGKGVARANVGIRAVGPRPRGTNYWSTIAADADGFFEQQVRRPMQELDLQVIAYTGTQSVFSDLENLGNAPGRCIDRRVVAIAPDAPEETFVQLRVVPGLAISGKVTAADGSPCAGHVAAIPDDAFAGDYVRGAPLSLDKEGRFEITGLLPGKYDLEVRPDKHYVFTDCLLTQRFTGIEAGSTALDLKLSEDRAVDVAIEVSAADGKLAAMTVVTGMFYPFTPRDPNGHVPEHERTYSGTFGWPKGATLSFGGQTGDQDAEGITGFLHLRGELPVHHCKPMNEGWYFLGIDATDVEGQHYHACGTGLVYLTPGSYRFHFDVVRQARIEGRITNADASSDLCVGLVTREGRPVQVLRTTRHLDEVVPIGSSGRFALDGAPVGEFRLRVGTEQQLRKGDFVHEIPVTIAAADNAPLVVHLP